MFLILASSCLARLHHSLLITRFLLPSTPPSSRARRSRGLVDPGVATPATPPRLMKGWASNLDLEVLGRATGTKLAAEESPWSPERGDGSAHRGQKPGFQASGRQGVVRTLGSVPGKAVSDVPGLTLLTLGAQGEGTRCLRNSPVRADRGLGGSGQSWARPLDTSVGYISLPPSSRPLHP